METSVPDPWFPMVTKLLVCTIARVLRVLVFKATSGAGQRGENWAIDKATMFAIPTMIQLFLLDRKKESMLLQVFG